MCEVNREYEKTVTYKNGVKVLYLLVLRSMYGCIQAALLWYKLYTLKLKTWDLKSMHMTNAWRIK